LICARSIGYAHPLSQSAFERIGSLKRLAEGNAMTILKTVFYSNPVWMWLLAVAIVAFVWFVLRIAMRLLVRRLRAFAAKTPGRFDDLIVELLAKTKFLFILVVSFYAGSLLLVLPGAAETALRALFILALLVQAGYWGDGVVTFWIRRTAKRKLEDDAATATSLTALGFVAKIAIWAIVLLLALDNFDKPFVIGDFIIVGDLMGTVERIGLKTTRVRSLSGEQIIFSNSDLLSSRVRNYKRMYERRIVFAFGVTYQTAPDVLEGIPETVRGIIEAQPDVRFDRCHFKSFGGFSLDFEAVYYVLLSDYNVYMDRQQAINLGIMRAFEDQGVEFAYPTQTLYVGRLGASESEEQ
jgi:hypothetical protein